MLMISAAIEAGAYLTLDTTYSITSKNVYPRMTCLAVSAFLLEKLRVLNDMWQHYNGYWHVAASSNLCFLLFLVVSSFSTPPRTLILLCYCR
jgi:hypothetical protein